MGHHTIGCKFLPSYSDYIRQELVRVLNRQNFGHKDDKELSRALENAPEKGQDLGVQIADALLFKCESQFYCYSLWADRTKHGDCVEMLKGI